MKQYPVMLTLAGKRVVVIGGGSVALRKVRDLLEIDAAVTVISPVFADGFADLASENDHRLSLEKRAYRHGDLEGAIIVFSATDDREINRTVFNEAAERNIFINAVDDPPHCTFTVPSSFRRGDLLVAVSTGGVSPAMAARIRRLIEKVIPDSVEDTLNALNTARSVLQNDELFGNLDTRGRGAILKRIVMHDELLSELVNAFRSETVKDFLEKISADTV